MRLHHVNLAVRPDLIDEEVGFLTKGIGLVRVDSPRFPTARWFAFPDGTEVHLSQTEEAVSTKPGHIALVLDDGFAATCDRLGALGLQPRSIDGLGMDVALYDDPAGHLWELRAS